MDLDNFGSSDMSFICIFWCLSAVRSFECVSKSSINLHFRFILWFHFYNLRGQCFPNFFAERVSLFLLFYLVIWSASKFLALFWFIKVKAVLFNLWLIQIFCGFPGFFLFLAPMFDRALPMRYKVWDLKPSFW